MTRPYNPELGPVAVTGVTPAEGRRWAKATNEGLMLAYPEDGAQQYHEVWILRLGARVRFIARGGRWYGPEHGGLYPAMCWAFAHGWIDPELGPEWSSLCAAEVWAHSTPLATAGDTR